jgi:hypothetical protein
MTPMVGDSHHKRKSIFLLKYSSRSFCLLAKRMTKEQKAEIIPHSTPKSLPGHATLWAKHCGKIGKSCGTWNLYHRFYF